MTHPVVIGSVLLSAINFYVDSSSIHQGEGSNGCEEDHQCHTNEFCFLETHICAPCYNCTSYNRKPSESKICSKEPLDCGKCMEGYKADRLTTGKERDYCYKDPDKQLPIDEEIQEIDKLPWIIGTIAVCGVIILIIIILVAFVIKYKRKRKPPHCEENVENGEDRNGEERSSEKPLLSTTVGKQENEEIFGIYSPSAPPPPYEGEIVQNLDTRNEHSEKQKASPFVFPEFPYLDEDPPSVNSDEGSEAEIPEVVDQEFHDADTLDAWSEEDEDGTININSNVEETNSNPLRVSGSEVFESVEGSSAAQNDSGISQTSSVVTSTRSLDINEEVDDGGQPSRKRPRNDSGTLSSEINISSDINSQSYEDRN